MLLRKFLSIIRLRENFHSWRLRQILKYAIIKQRNEKMDQKQKYSDKKLKNLLEESRGIALLPKAEKTRTVERIMKMKKEKRIKIFEMLLNEEMETEKINQQYDGEVQKAYDKYILSVQEAQKKIAKNIKTNVEKRQAERDEKTQESLLAELDNV